MPLQATLYREYDNIDIDTLETLSFVFNTQER